MELDAKKICGVVATAHAEREVVKSRREKKETAFPSSKANNIDPHLIQQSSAPSEIPIMHGCYFWRKQADRRLPMLRSTPSILFDFNSRMRVDSADIASNAFGRSFFQASLSYLSSCFSPAPSPLPANLALSLSTAGRSLLATHAAHTHTPLSLPPPAVVRRRYCSLDIHGEEGGRYQRNALHTGSPTYPKPRRRRAISPIENMLWGELN